jgi:hypothetical protein
MRSRVRVYSLRGLHPRTSVTVLVILFDLSLGTTPTHLFSHDAAVGILPLWVCRAFFRRYAFLPAERAGYPFSMIMCRHSILSQRSGLQPACLQPMQ